MHTRLVNLQSLNNLDAGMDNSLKKWEWAVATFVNIEGTFNNATPYMRQLGIEGLENIYATESEHCYKAEL